MCRGCCPLGALRPAHEQADRDFLERAEHPDLFALPSGGGFDPGKRARSLDDDGRFVGRRDGPPRSAVLRALTALLAPRFGVIDRVLSSMGAKGIGSTDYAEQLRARLLAAWEAEGRMDVKELRLCTKLGLLVQKYRAQQQQQQQQVTREGGGGELVAEERAHGAEALWEEIVARTDELYEVSEAMQPAFLRVCRRVFHDVGQAIDERYGKYAAFTDGGLKDPVRLHEKAVDDYAHRFADGVLPEACVTDVVRARATFTEAKRFRLLDEALRRGYRFDEDGATYRLELVRGKNKFRALDPTHLRMMLYNLELVVEWRDEATGCAPRRPPSRLQLYARLRASLARRANL